MRWGGWGSNPRPSDYEYALQPFTRDQERPDLGKRTQSATPGQAELLPKLLPETIMAAFEQTKDQVRWVGRVGIEPTTGGL